MLGWLHNPSNIWHKYLAANVLDSQFSRQIQRINIVLQAIYTELLTVDMASQFLCNFISFPFWCSGYFINTCIPRRKVWRIVIFIHIFRMRTYFLIHSSHVFFLPRGAGRGVLSIFPFLALVSDLLCFWDVSVWFTSKLHTRSFFTHVISSL